MIQVWLMASSLGFMLIDRQTEAHPDWRTCRHTYFPRYFATYSRSYTPTHANRHTHTTQTTKKHTHTQTNKHHLYASAHAAHIMPAKRKHVLFLAMLDSPSEKLKIQAISARSPKNLNCLKPYLDPMKPASLRFLIPVSLYTPSKIR